MAGTERTALYQEHLALGGKMVDFGGWELPQQYGSIRDEHVAVHDPSLPPARCRLTLRLRPAVPLARSR